MKSVYDRQRGFAAVFAVMLIVVFALIGTFMLTTVGSQNMTTALSQREMQAWFAAQSGLDWAINQVVGSSSGCVAAGACPTDPCPTVTGTALSPAGSATGFNIARTCSCTCVNESSAGQYAVYQLSATATGGSAADPDYVSRSARASVKE